MKQITFYLDFISPYAYLAFERLPLALQGLSYTVVYKPVLFAGMLKHHGQLGPAEIPAKRAWTYRQITWLAREHGIALDLPSAHPFNPMALLRLALACQASGQPNRHTCETIFRHVWCGGADAEDAERLNALTQQLQPAHDATSESVKARLRANTEEAIQAGVFGVPGFEVGGEILWGLDALPMLREHLAGDSWVGGDQWIALAKRDQGITRQR